MANRAVIPTTDMDLILAVKKSPWLYDLQRPDYKNNLKQKLTWEMIAENLNITSGPECRQQWHRLRAKFTQELKRRKTGTPVFSSPEKERWFQSLSFLIPHIRERNTSVKTGALTEDDVKPDVKKLLPSSTLLVRTPVTSSAPTLANEPSAMLQRAINAVKQEPKPTPTVVVIRETKPQTCTTSTVQPTANAAPLVPTTTRPPTKKVQRKTRKAFRARKQDEDDLFGASIAQTLKACNPKLKAKAKLKIQQIMYSVRFEDMDSLEKDFL